MQLIVQLASLLGASLILFAYLALQRRWWPSSAPLYLWCNLVGALLLTAVAIHDRRIGFIVLEAVWASVTLASMVRGDASPDAT